MPKFNCMKSIKISSKLSTFFIGLCSGAAIGVARWPQVLDPIIGPSKTNSQFTTITASQVTSLEVPVFAGMKSRIGEQNNVNKIQNSALLDAPNFSAKMPAELTSQRDGQTFVGFNKVSGATLYKVLVTDENNKIIHKRIIKTPNLWIPALQPSLLSGKSNAKQWVSILAIDKNGVDGQPSEKRLLKTAPKAKLHF